MMNENYLQFRHFVSQCFFFSLIAAAADLNHISISCGGAAAASAVTGRRWSGDAAAKGASTASSVKGELIAAVDPVPYISSRISLSQFSYSFPLNPGQKFIRLHFNPASYHGFHRFNDLFTVEAGSFTLLANFSASITARAHAVNILAKEFCVILHENETLDIVFSPESRQSKYNYAFINGIEIISVPSTVSYCHGGESGVHMLGQNYVIHLDKSNALEMVHRQNIKWGSDYDIGSMFGMWNENANRAYNRSWRVAADVGFRYLVRLHLCELGLKIHEDFTLLIDDIIALTSADRAEGKSSILWYNYMVIVEGHKREGKRNISISLQSQREFLDRHGPFEGFEVFKISNHDRSLASPNPLPLPPRPRGDSPSHTNAIATAVITVICLVLLHKMWGAVIHLVKNRLLQKMDTITRPSARAKRLCRRFSLAEIQSATENFHEGFVLGKGGYGKVYKGKIDNGREIVAIKRLKPGSKQGEHQFWTEVEMLSEVRHVNLVSLIGYCTQKEEMILVYEYMPSGTLADHLYKLPRKNHLSWLQRLNICIGVGRAIDYLHTGHGIIHRDVKASNILLDHKFVAKVSDFGLAKFGILSESSVGDQESTNLKGTDGYIDPDFFTTRKLTKKSDMYSLGVVLLQVLCGRAAVEPGYEADKWRLTTWAIANISKGQVDHIVDPSLRGEISQDSLNTFVKVAIRCLHDEPEKRPTTAYVVTELQTALKLQEKEKSLPPLENVRSLARNEITYVTSLPREQSKCITINSGSKNPRKTVMSRISQTLRWDAFRKTMRPSCRTDLGGISVSAGSIIPSRNTASALAVNG